MLISPLYKNSLDFKNTYFAVGTKIFREGGGWPTFGGGGCPPGPNVEPPLGAMGSFRWANGERVEREPITGVWGQSPQRGPGAEPLVRGRGRCPPEAESFLALGRATDTDRANYCTLCRIFSNPLQ